MSTRPVFTSYAKQFSDKVKRRNDIALGDMAQEIEMIAAFYGPVLSGNLIRKIKKKRKSANHWQVRVDEDYAAYQERGMRHDGTNIVKKYTTPGTGKHYLARAGRLVSGRALHYFRKAHTFASNTSSVSGGGSGLKSKTDMTQFSGD